MIIALSHIKGLGYNLSQVILQSLNINSNMRIGFLTEKEVSDIEAAIKNPSLIGIPNWYLNSRKDGAVGVKKVTLRPTAGGPGAPAEAKEGGAAAPAAGTATPEASAPKSSAPTSPETKE